MSVAGKVVVITGGTRGIGLAVAEECARSGARVVVCGVCEDRLADAVARISNAGSTPAEGIVADVSDFNSVERLRDFALDRCGRVDVWFNNAGISLGYHPVDEQPAEDLARIVSTNLTGHIFGCRVILPYFRERGGYLMNMAGRGYRGEATPHTAIYAATKTAIVSLTRSLAAENKGIGNLSINALVPGMVETDFYRDLSVSPRLEKTKDNWRFALDAFGVPLETVATEGARLLGEEPGRRTGEVISLLTTSRTMRGVAKMAWYSMTGKMVRE
ncbi:MAG TPA: SDR family oxidoreductase [Coriobacteriia bacterium]|nr:SDR family oxidoreductase [Coriobacteriia bacterium]